MTWVKDNLNLIALIPTIFFFVIVFLYIIRGMMRGFRKSLILLINALIAMICAYLFFLFVLSTDSFQIWVIDLLKNTFSINLNKILGIPETAKTLNDISREIVQKRLDFSQETVAIMESYIFVFTQIILAFFYLIITVIVYHLFKFVLYIFYLIFFREGRRKRKIKKEYNEKQSEKRYNKRLILGGIVGAIRGTLIACFILGIFGSLFFMTSGGNRNFVKEGESITINSNTEEYDLTLYYQMMDSYSNTGIMNLLEGIRDSNGMPIYSAYINLFVNGNLVIEEQDIKTKIRPVHEVAAITNSLHKIIKLLSDYNINVSSSTLIDEIIEILESEDEEKFISDLKVIIGSVGKTELQKVLGKTINLYFANAIKAEGLNNKYFDEIFLGENALTISDLFSKSDIEVYFKILKNTLSIFSNYSQNKNVIKTIVDRSSDISNIADLILDLSLFNNNKISTRVNSIISNLLSLAFDSSEIFKGVDLSNINWLTISNVEVSASGEINNFIKAFSNFMDAGVLGYNENLKLKFNLSKLDDLWIKNTETDMSAIDYVASSQALRKILSFAISNVLVNGQNVYIPSSALESGTNNISTLEFVKLFKSLGVVINKANLSDELTIDSIKNEMLPTIVNVFKDEDVINEIFDSVVLESIISKSLYNLLSSQGYDNYLVSSLILNEETIDSNIYNWIGEGKETRNILIIASSILQKGVINFVDGKLTYDFSKIGLLLETDELGNSVINKISNSLLLRSALSGLLKNNVGQDLIYIPESAYDSDYSDGKVLKTSEIESIFQSLKSLLDFVDINSSTLSNDLLVQFPNIIKSDETISSISESDVLKASISIQIYKALSNNTSTASSIPESLVLDVDKIDANINNWILPNGEFDSIINAFKILEESEIIALDLSTNNAISPNLNNINNLFNGDEVEPIDKILESQIIHVILSKEFTNLDIGYKIYLPNQVMDDDVIEKIELKKAFNSVTVLIDGLDITSSDIKDLLANKINDIVKDDNKIDKLLSSIIIEGTLVNIVWSNVSQNEQLSVNVPDYLNIDTSNDNFNNWIGEGKELRKILKAISIVDLNNASDINFMFKLNEDDISVLNNSDIVAFFITDKITSVSNDSIQIHVLDESYEESRPVIKSEEIYSLINSIKKLVNYDDSSSDNFNLDEISFDISEIISDLELIDLVLESLIIDASISHKVFSLLDTKISIPEDLVLSEEDNSNIYNWVSINTDGELKKLINSMNVLGLSNMINDFEFTTTNIFTNIIGDNDPVNPNYKSYEMVEENTNKIIESKIIWLTISGLIIGLSTGDNSILVVDSDDMVDSSYLSTIEIVNLVLGTKALNITNFDEIDSNTILNDVDIDKILNSNTLYLTIESKIKTIDELSISKYALDITTELITKDEIKNLVLSLNELGVSDMASFNTNSFISNSNSFDFSIILKSFIIWYTMSESIRGSSQGGLSVPENAYESDMTQYIPENYAGDNDEIFVSILEIQSLMKALELLGYDLGQSSISSNALLSLSNGQLDTLLESNIIWFNISLSLINLSSIKILEQSKTVEFSDTFVIKEEIKYLISAFNALGATDTDSFVVNPSSLNDSNVERINQSMIMRSTISKLVLYDQALKTINEGIEQDISEYLIFTTIEVRNLVKSLQELNITDLSNISSSINISTIITSDTESREIIVDSYTMWYFVSNLLDNPLIPPNSENRIDQNIVYVENTDRVFDTENILTKDFIINYSPF